ncbi:MAG: hypothetical protein RL210_2244, partial [Pseudomonadota bacterium]
MLQLQADSQQTVARKLSVALAENNGQIREAQKLRYRVFVDEMGARLNSPEAGLDIDIFDAWCDHLLVRDDVTNEVVGTYRILPPHQAKRIGSLYSESEFDLTRLANLR